MLKLLKTFAGPRTWCRHVHLVRTNLRLCHRSSIQSALQDHQVGGANNCQSRSDQLDGQQHQEAVDFDRQTSYNPGQVNYTSEVNTDDHHLVVTRGVGKFQDEQTQKYLLQPDQPPDARVLRVAILGAPNAGKSTLVNHLLTWKVNPVSSKVHTTRKNSEGVFTEGNTQIVFTDTPGVITPAERKKHHCDTSLLVDPKRSVEEVDLIGVLVDVANKYTREAIHREILKILKDYQHIPSVLILNKVDELRKPDILLELINTLTAGVVGGSKVAAIPVRKPRGNRKQLAHEMIDMLTEKYGKLEQSRREDRDFRFRSERFDKTMAESSDRRNEKGRKYLGENIESTDGKVNKLDIEGTSVDYYSVTTGSEQSLKIRQSSNKLEYFDDSVDSFKDSLHEIPSDSNVRKVNDLDYSSHTVKAAMDEEDLDDDFRDYNENKTLEKFKSSGYQKLGNHERVLKSHELENEKQIGVSDISKPSKFKSDFFPSKDKTSKGFDPEQDLSKYVTPWEDLMPTYRETERGWPHFDRVFIVSSLTGDGMEDLKAYFLNEAVPGDWAFHSSLVTYEDPHELARLIVWSKLLDHLKGYVAYSLEPEIAFWKYEDDSTLKIVMNLKVKHVDRVIGPNGLIIRKIAEKSQQALMDAFRCEVALKLVVKKKITSNK